MTEVSLNCFLEFSQISIVSFINNPLLVLFSSNFFWSIQKETIWGKNDRNRLSHNIQTLGNNM